MIDEVSKADIIEEVVLSKFEGEPVPENEIERVYIVDGTITKIETIENGEVVSTKEV